MQDQVQNTFRRVVWGTDVEEPHEHQLIWRYLTLPSFLFLINEKRLHFSRLWELDDLSEGHISQSQVNDLAVGLEDNESFHLLPTLLKMYQNFVAGCAISCWHASDTESTAMWGLYTTGDDGIAIQTTVSLLKKALGSKGFDDLNFGFHVGFVKYIDHQANVFTETAPESQTALCCVFQKRREYSHEREVRLVKVMPQDRPYSSSDLNFPLQDLSFIEQVIVSPRFPMWGISALQSLIKMSGLPINLGASALRDSLRPR
jgi:hypothetical protein